MYGMTLWHKIIVKQDRDPGGGGLSSFPASESIPRPRGEVNFLEVSVFESLLLTT